MVIKDKKGYENLVADHLSRIEKKRDEGLTIKENFPNETLLTLQHAFTPWFADIANFLAYGQVPADYGYQQKKKL